MKTSKRSPRAAPWLAVLALGTAPLAAAPAQAPPVANLRQIVLLPAPPGARLEIFADRATTPVVELEAPDRLALELDRARPAYGVHGSVYPGGLVAELRLIAAGVPSRPRTRVEIRLRSAVAYRVSVDGARLVVDLVPESEAARLAEPSAPTPTLPEAPAPPPATREAPPLPVSPPSEPVPATTADGSIEGTTIGTSPIDGTEDSVVAPPLAVEAEETTRPPLPIVEPERPAPSTPAAAEIESEDLDDFGALPAADLAPARSPPPLVPAPVETVDEIETPIEPAPRPSAAPRLREPVDPEPVVELDARPGRDALGSTAPQPRPGEAPRPRLVPFVESEPVATIEVEPGFAPGLVATPRPEASELRLRDAIDAATIEPLDASAPPVEVPPLPGAPVEAAPLRIEIEPSAVQAELLPDELVPPADIPRPVAPTPARPATRVLAIERLDAGAVRIAADGTLGYLTFRLDNPDRFVVELEGIVNQSAVDSLRFDEAVLLRVRIAQYRRTPRPVTRIVFDVRAPTVPAIESTSDGLVVRFARRLPTLSDFP